MASKADNEAGNSVAGAQDVSETDTWLYFEAQQAALCGVHAINTLLQGPYFTEIDLAEASVAQY